MSKYELTNMSIEFEGHVLYRIRASVNIGKIEKGTLGGFIESEENLSQCGKCWVHDGACVYGNARVIENAHILDTAVVKDSAVVSGNAIVEDNVIISKNARVLDSATILDHAIISGDAVISKDALIGNISIIDGNAKIGKHGFIQKREDYMLIENFGSENSSKITIYRGYSNFLYVHASKFRGTIDDYWKQIKMSDGLTRQTKRKYNRLIKSIKMAMNN